VKKHIKTCAPPNAAALRRSRAPGRTPSGRTLCALVQGTATQVLSGVKNAGYTQMTAKHELLSDTRARCGPELVRLIRTTIVLAIARGDPYCLHCLYSHRFACRSHNRMRGLVVLVFTAAPCRVASVQPACWSA
jgi:hypothetical protein